MTSIETYISDKEFCQEIIDLVQGTHWTKGNLKTYCEVPVPLDYKAAPGEEVVQMWMMYHKHTRMRYIAERQEWLLTVPSRRTPNPPIEREWGAEPHFTMDGDLRASTHGVSGRYTRPVRVGRYKKAQWCLIGMVLKVAKLHEEDEFPLYTSPDDTGYAERALNAAQPWRIIDGILEGINDFEIRRTKGMTAYEAQSDPWAVPQPSIRTPGSAVTRVESWNDVEVRTREEVIEVVEFARDNSVAIISGEAS